MSQFVNIFKNNNAFRLSASEVENLHAQYQNVYKCLQPVNIKDLVFKIPNYLSDTGSQTVSTSNTKIIENDNSLQSKNEELEEQITFLKSELDKSYKNQKEYQDEISQLKKTINDEFFIHFSDDQKEAIRAAIIKIEFKHSRKYRNPIDAIQNFIRIVLDESTIKIKYPCL